jgi:carbamoyl-phosphate synthase small subunit
MKQACLVLEDGTYYLGKAIGKRQHKSFGEIVFNTGLCGYQEILTDPSYAGQIVTLTYPEIGNYGISQLDNQSRKAFAAGLVIKNLSPVSSSWRGKDGDLEQFLLDQNLSGIYGIDTRALTRHIRSRGAMRSLLSTEEVEFDSKKIAELLAEVKHSKEMTGQDLAAVVSTPKAYAQKCEGKAIASLVVLDFGLKRNMLTLLNQQGFDLQVLPANASYEDILSCKPAGVFLSNGPGDPEACLQAQETVKKLVENEIAPIFGVCLGHQILSIALGAKTFKLKFGHRGSNHPVKDLTNGRVFITSQNHGFAVQEETLPLSQVKVTHKSLNDDTIEGIEHLHKQVFSVQFHPEACPGPHDTDYLFLKFTEMVKEKIAQKN